MIWRIISASVIGSGHARTGTPCQDAHAVRVLSDGTLVAAVADGAGSAARAREGAAAAVARAVAEIAGVVEPDGAIRDRDCAAMATAFGSARREIEELAIQYWAPLRDFACTLTCVIARPDRLVVGQVGDGVAVARGVDGRLFAASTPQKGEYANEAVFLTHGNPGDGVVVTVVDEPVAAVGITSDGLLRLALDLPHGVPFAPFWEPLWAFAAREDDSNAYGATARLAAFLNSPRVTARTDDDKTLVLAVRVDIGGKVEGGSEARGDGEAGRRSDGLGDRPA